MRVVYVWDSDYPWDIRTEKICLALTQAGHEVHVVARNRRWGPLLEQRTEGLVHRMRPWKWLGRKLDGYLGFPAFFSPRWRSLVGSTARGARADVIIVRDLPLCPTAIAVGRSLGIPVVLDMAEHYPAIMKEIFTSGRSRPLDHLVRNPSVVARVERHCLSRVDHVFTVVQESSDRLVRLGVSPDRLTVVGNTPPVARAARPPEYRPDDSATRGGKRIDLVYLGLLEVSRGINDLLDACKRLSSTASVRLLLIGGGRDEQIFRDYARKLGLSDADVVFFGYVPYDEAIAMVAAADVGVLPIHVNEHLNTTLPNKLFDYMSVGIPVITSDSVPSARVVRETGCGEVFREKDVADLVAAIGRLVDPATRAAMGRAGRAAIERSYNWERDTATMLRSLERVAFRARPGPDDDSPGEVAR